MADTRSTTRRALNPSAGATLARPRACSFDVDATYRSVVWEFVRSLGSNLMSGGAELTRTPFPVYINQPRSYLESIADGWVTAPHILAKVQSLTQSPAY